MISKAVNINYIINLIIFLVIYESQNAFGQKEILINDNCYFDNNYYLTNRIKEEVVYRISRYEGLSEYYKEFYNSGDTAEITQKKFNHAGDIIQKSEKYQRDTVNYYYENNHLVRIEYLFSDIDFNDKVENYIYNFVDDINTVQDSIKNLEEITLFVDTISNNFIISYPSNDMQRTTDIIYKYKDGMQTQKIALAGTDTVFITFFSYDSNRVVIERSLGHQTEGDHEIITYLGENGLPDLIIDRNISSGGVSDERFIRFYYEGGLLHKKVEISRKRIQREYHYKYEFYPLK